MTDTTSGTRAGKGGTAKGGRSGAKAGAPGQGAGLRVERIFTTPGVHPYDEVNWERRDVVMTNWRDGSVNFDQRGVEFPDFWSVNATNIVTSKYFRGALGTPQREWSLKQIIDRVVQTYRAAGEKNGYFASAGRRRDLRARADPRAPPPGVQLQLAGLVQRRHPAAAAGQRLLHPGRGRHHGLDPELVPEEGMIFKGGSGAGLNLSRIRSSKELLSSGGNASGPVSFMRGADASAGTIKSGGATRRAAKMVVLDVDHPDIEDFIETKVKEEDKIRVLRDAGLRHGPRRGRHHLRPVPERQQLGPGQRRVHAGRRERRRVRPAGPDSPARSSRPSTPRSLFRKMAEAAWACADPGIQYDDHDQRLAHQPGDRPDQRVQPVLRVHAPGQLLAATSPR